VKKQFQHIEKELQECLDDVSLAMGADAMHALNNVQFLLTPKVTNKQHTSTRVCLSATNPMLSLAQVAVPVAEEKKVEEEPEIPDWHINYLELEFETRRGVRKELGTG
jgi:hypothetical protein